MAISFRILTSLLSATAAAALALPLPLPGLGGMVAVEAIADGVESTAGTDGGGRTPSKREEEDDGDVSRVKAMGVNEQFLCRFLFFMGKARRWLSNRPLLLRAHVSHVA